VLPTQCWCWWFQGPASSRPSHTVSEPHLVLKSVCSISIPEFDHHGRPGERGELPYAGCQGGNRFQRMDDPKAAAATQPSGVEERCDRANRICRHVHVRTSAGSVCWRMHRCCACTVLCQYFNLNPFEVLSRRFRRASGTACLHAMPDIAPSAGLANNARLNRGRDQEKLSQAVHSDSPGGSPLDRRWSLGCY
jgi:hypothetical protein